MALKIIEIEKIMEGKSIKEECSVIEDSQEMDICETIIEDQKNAAQNSNEETVGFKWPHDAILILIEEYQKEKRNLISGLITQKKMWNKIGAKLKSKGYRVSGSQCLSKFSGLKRTFKNIKRHNNSPGTLEKSWPYYALVEEMLKSEYFTLPAQTTPTSSYTGINIKNSSELHSESSISDVENMFTKKTEKRKSTFEEQLINSLDKRAKKNEENRERRFQELMAFKAQKADKNMKIKLRIVKLLEKLVESSNKS